MTYPYLVSAVFVFGGERYGQAIAIIGAESAEDAKSAMAERVYQDYPNITAIGVVAGRIKDTTIEWMFLEMLERGATR